MTSPRTSFPGFHSFMEDLPSDLQAHIVQRAELPIDTFLHFRRALGVTPKRLALDPAAAERLSAHWSHRASEYARKRELERASNGATTAPLAHFAKHLRPYDPRSGTRGRHVEVMVDHVDGRTKMAIRHSALSRDEMWTLRKTVVDVHTGEDTSDWIASDDDSDL